MIAFQRFRIIFSQEGVFGLKANMPDGKWFAKTNLCFLVYIIVYFLHINTNNLS